MTAVTVAVGPTEEPSLRPLPWRRMAWVTWRHHRIALSGVMAFLGVLALWLYTAGLQLHHAYAAAAACHPASSAACQNLIGTFEGTNMVLKYGLVLQPVPALIGAFIGAPMLAREIETGTFRYAWTQGFGRWRWTLAKLVIVGVAVAVVAGAFSVLLAWYYQPYFATSHGTQFSSASPLSPGLFDLRGVAFAGWTLTAFAIGALAGMLTRRVVPAIVATLASYTILAVPAGIVIGHTAWADHHPASHFWPLQWIEGGCLLTLSTLLVAITVWLVQRRAV
jgi:ABC-2 family transporter